MSDSPLHESDSLVDIQTGADPYVLLRSYGRDAKIKSKAYGYSEAYYRWLHKVLTYPLVVLSAISTVISGFDIHPYSNYVVMGLSMVTLVIVGFNQAVQPKDKEMRANQLNVEYNEIASNIRQFIHENSKSDIQVKAYSEIIHSEMNIWHSLAPPIQRRFIVTARRECVSRARKSRNIDYGSNHGKK